MRILICIMAIITKNCLYIYNLAIKLGSPAFCSQKHNFAISITHFNTKPVSVYFHYSIQAIIWYISHYTAQWRMYQDQCRWCSWQLCLWIDTHAWFKDTTWCGLMRPVMVSGLLFICYRLCEIFHKDHIIYTYLYADGSFS